MENTTSNISKLALLRKARNLTHAELAAYLNVSINDVEKYETGELEMDAATANTLATFFNVSPAYFMVENRESKTEREEKKESLGGKILQLRKSRGLTQADLGLLLNVSYQAVSKWERDESCPDFETLSKLAQYCNVSVSYFEKENKDGAVDTSGRDVEEFVGVCKDCGVVVYANDVGERTPQLLCKSCVERRANLSKIKAEEEKRDKERKAEEEKRIKEKKAQEAKFREQEAQLRAAEYDAEVKRTRNRGLIWAAVLIGVPFLIYVISAFASGVKAGVVIPTALVGLVFLYTYVAQLFWDGAVVDCTLAGGKTIGTPGVIFTLDLDGLIFLIVVKILFAVLRFIVFMLTVVVCALAAIFIAPFTFFPALKRVSNGN